MVRGRFSARGKKGKKARNQKFNSDAPSDCAAAVRSRMKMISARGERKVGKRPGRWQKSLSLSQQVPTRKKRLAFAYVRRYCVVLVT